MSTLALLVRLAHLGARLRHGGEQLLYQPRGLPPDVIDQIKAHKPLLLAILARHGDDLPTLVERVEEHAAIMQYDGGLRCEAAERLAVEHLAGFGDVPAHAVASLRLADERKAGA